MVDGYLGPAGTVQGVITRVAHAIKTAGRIVAGGICTASTVFGKAFINVIITVGAVVALVTGAGITIVLIGARAVIATGVAGAVVNAIVAVSRDR